MNETKTPRDRLLDLIETSERVLLQVDRNTDAVDAWKESIREARRMLAEPEPADGAALLREFRRWIFREKQRDEGVVRKLDELIERADAARAPAPQPAGGEAFRIASHDIPDDPKTGWPVSVQLWRLHDGATRAYTLAAKEQPR